MSAAETKQNTDQERAREQAAAQMEAISTMVSRLRHCEECDGEDCELTDREIIEGLDIFYQKGTIATDAQREEFHDREQIEQAIQEDPLSIEVRSGWHTPGEGNEAEEFRILLCTGGPAVQIRGELGEYNQASRAWLEYQDWFTPWTEYFGDNLSADDLLTYAQQFYFGE